MLVNPAASPVLTPVLAALPGFISQVAPQHGLSNAQIEARFAEALRAAAGRVYAIDTDYYRPVADAVTGPFSEGARRDLAWARHADWIRGLFTREPIFSPNETEVIPLAAVYHRLRCFWHEERAPEGWQDRRERPDPDQRPDRIAHVADLHATLWNWLKQEGRGDAIKIVAGGPGSGKSSFARAFSGEVVAAAEHRVVFVPLQRMPLGGDLRERLGTFLRRQWHASNPAGGAGFEENPLDWLAWETVPYLLVFDGLDELIHDDDTARKLALRFVASVKRMLAELTGPSVKALVLGRSVACEEAVRRGDLGLRTLMHFAPLTALASGAGSVLGPVSSVEDPGGIGARDERFDFWRRLARARGATGNAAVPPAVTGTQLAGLNAEPLLLHLLFVSGYLERIADEIEDSRNLIYEAIFDRVFERDLKKLDGDGAKFRQARTDFFTLLECLGLAAWRGNGRTGSEAQFAEIRGLHATEAQRERFTGRPAMEQRNIAVRFYTRHDLGTPGFEFVHKSFGEYLAARGIVSAALREAGLIAGGEKLAGAAAEDWARLIGRAELTDEVLDFLFIEARLRKRNETAPAVEPLKTLFSWVQQNGVPVHLAEPGASFRALETAQRCAETALLAALNAIWRGAEGEDPTYSDGGLDGRVLSLPFGDERAAIRLLNRIRATPHDPARRLFARTSFRGADLRGANLEGLDLSWSDLSKADLSWANLRSARLRGNAMIKTKLRGANLSGATLQDLDPHSEFRETDLSEAVLRGAVLDRLNMGETDLSGADLSGVDLSDWTCRGASLRSTRLHESRHLSAETIGSAFGVRSGIGKTLLPEEMAYPEHWHVGGEGDPIAEEAAYVTAYRAWLATLE